jgi:TRAP-type C4-dicarboxylate transport system permease small subunit
MNVKTATMQDVRSGPARDDGPAPVRWVMAASRALLAVERRAIMGFMFLLSALILVNVATRYARMPIYWIDESAVYAVVWLTFIGASAMTRLRLDFAVTMLTEKLPATAQRLARIIATSLVVAFALALVAMCWLWFDPVGIAAAGFDAKAFAGETFNFLYTERTQTLNWPSWVLFLILPIFALSMVIHGLANLFEDMGLTAKLPAKGFTFGQVDAVN